MTPKIATKVWEQFTFRLGKRLRAELQKEADAENRSLANYVLRLLETHPDRQKKKI